MNEQLTVGSLFSGIGGFDLGLECAGMRTVWFCEQDPFCRRVLARHWPEVPCFSDVRGLHEPEPVDVLCGGFPCQDISLAGAGAGLAGERSGLWREFARLIGELRPRYVIVENVPALTHRGLDVVLSDLAACGFDAEWDHLPASAFGAPHRRDRIWLVAYPGSEGRRQDPRGAHGDEAADAGWPAADDHIPVGTGTQRLRAGGRDQDVADTGGERRNGWPGGGRARRDQAERDQAGGHAGDGGAPPRLAERGGWWLTEPDVGRVAHGIPARVDRLRALGNALVPQIAEWIGRQIIQWEDQIIQWEDQADRHPCPEPAGATRGQ